MLVVSTVSRTGCGSLGEQPVSFAVDSAVDTTVREHDTVTRESEEVQREQWRDAGRRDARQSRLDQGVPAQFTVELDSYRIVAASTDRSQADHQDILKHRFGSARDSA